MRLPSTFPLFAGPIARGAAVSFAIRLGGLGIATLQAILTARLLGAEGYGAVAFVLSLSSIFATIALMGTEPLAAREVARLQALKDFAGLKGLLGRIRRVVIAAALIGALAWSVGWTFLLPDRTGAAWSDLGLYVALVFPLLALTLQTQGVLRGFGRVAGAQLPIFVVRPLILVVFLVAAWALSWTVSPNDYMIIVVIGSSMAFLLAHLLLRGTVAPLRDSPADPPGTRSVVQAAAPFLAISVIGLLAAEINTVLLTLWASSEQAGLFQPVARISPLLVLAIQAVAIRYGPRISELLATGETARLARVTRQVTLATTGFTLLSAALLLVFAKPILGLFGPEFTAMSRALWWIAGAQVINAACGPVGLLLSMSSHASRTVVPQLFGLALNVLVGAFLIPTMGAEGAGIALAVGIVGWNIAMLLTVRRHLGEDPSLWGLWRSRSGPVTSD